MDIQTGNMALDVVLGLVAIVICAFALVVVAAGFRKKLYVAAGLAALAATLAGICGFALLPSVLTALFILAIGLATIVLVKFKAARSMLWSYRYTTGLGVFLLLVTIILVAVPGSRSIFFIGAGVVAFVLAIVAFRRNVLVGLTLLAAALGAIGFGLMLMFPTFLTSALAVYSSHGSLIADALIAVLALVIVVVIARIGGWWGILVLAVGVGTSAVIVVLLMRYPQYTGEEIAALIVTLILTVLVNISAVKRWIGRHPIGIAMVGGTIILAIVAFAAYKLPVARWYIVAWAVLGTLVLVLGRIIIKNKGVRNFLISRRNALSSFAYVLTLMILTVIGSQNGHLTTDTLGWAELGVLVGLIGLGWRLIKPEKTKKDANASPFQLLKRLGCPLGLLLGTGGLVRWGLLAWIAWVVLFR